VNALGGFSDIDDGLNCALVEARELLEECELVAPGSRDVPQALIPRRDRISYRFNQALTRTAMLMPQSPLLSSLNLVAVQRASNRINAALRLRDYQESGENLDYDEDVFRGAREAGFIENMISAGVAIAVIKEALESISGVLSTLHAQTAAEATANSQTDGPCGNFRPSSSDGSGRDRGVSNRGARHSIAESKDGPPCQ
jgi:hypothetical protein